MRELHLSDEAVAAYADGVLGTAARERARRHTERCAECHHAVAVQREAVWALRAAPAPALPSSLLDRLRDVPATTPVHRVPASFDDRGTPMFAAFGTSLGLVANPKPPTGRDQQRDQQRDQRRDGHRSELRAHRTRNFVVAAASLAVMGSLTGTALADTGSESAPPAGPASVTPAPAVVPAAHVAPAVQFARAFAPLRP